MNKIKNDRGELVYAVGEDGSIARTKCQYPAALERVDALFFAGCYSHYSNIGVSYAYLDAFNELREIYSPEVTDQILKASLFCETQGQ